MLRIASIFPWGVFATLSSPCTVIPGKARRISTTPTPWRSHRGSFCRQRSGKRIEIEKPHVREQYPSSRHVHLPHASMSVAGGGSYIPPTRYTPLQKLPQEVLQEAPMSGSIRPSHSTAQAYGMGVVYQFHAQGYSTT